MTLIKYMLQGTTGNTVADGTAATLANLGIPTGGTGVVNAGTGGSCLFKTAAKFINTYGLRLSNGATSPNYVRFPPNATSTVMARTTALTVPNPLPTGANVPTIWNMIASSGSPLRLQCNASGHLLLLKISGTTVDLGAFTAGQKVVVRTFISCLTSTTGHLDFELQNVGGGTISGTAVSVTNADLGAASPIVYGAVAASTGTPAEAYVVDVGYDLWDDGRVSFIPQEADVVAAVDSGTISSVVDSVGYTASPSGTIFTALSDTDATTVCRSPIATSTYQKMTVAFPRMTAKASLVTPVNMAKSPGAVGDGSIIFELLDSTAAVRGTQTVVTSSTVPPPTTLTWDSSVCSTITVDSGGAWTGVTLRWGVKV